MNPTDRKMIGNNSLIDQKDIKRTITTIAKNWYWFILFLVLGISGALFYLYKAPNIYGATSQILIQPPKDPFKDAMSESLPTPAKKEDVANEMMILQSTRLIEEAINKLNIDISYYIRGRIKTGEVYNGTPFRVEGKISDKSLYEVPFEVQILDRNRFRVEINTEDFKFQKIARFGEPVVSNAFSFILNNDSEVISRNNRISDINYQFKFHDRNQLIKSYQRAMKVEKEEGSTVINISVEDEVPERGIDFLNTLNEIYIENSISVSKSVNENTLAFIESQLREVEAQLNSVESNLEQFQKEKTTFNLGQEQSVLFQRLVDFDSEKSRINIQLKSIDQLYEYLTSNSENLAISPSLLAEQNDNSLATSFNELFALQQKKNNLLFSNTASSPLVKETDAQISIIKQNILGIILNLRRTLVSKINSLDQQVNEYQGTIRQMPTTQRGLVNINRNVEIYSRIYEFLLETRAQNIIAKAGIVADKSVLEPAISTGLLHPIPAQTMATGIGGAIAMAFLVIFFKGMFYNYVQTKEDLKEITQLPIIGVIGKSKDAESEYLVVDKFAQSQTAEAFRVIRTNLTYFAPKVTSKTILVTSSMAGEGKTFCAVNIATILAKARKKVILLDLDLHKPKQANAFDLQNDIGITSYIVGKATTNQIIKDTSIENLQVILTGPRTPNASEMILDPMLEQLIQELKAHYEFIILDTPPVGLLSDALVLMKYSDLNLYIFKAGYSKKDFVDIAHQLVEKPEVKNLSFILNGVNSKHIPAGYGGGYYT
jgi:tyrosine-protein kinase Etk/Wzc